MGAGALFMSFTAKGAGLLCFFFLTEMFTGFGLDKNLSSETLSLSFVLTPLRSILRVKLSLDELKE